MSNEERSQQASAIMSTGSQGVQVRILGTDRFRSPLASMRCLLRTHDGFERIEPPHGGARVIVWGREEREFGLAGYGYDAVVERHGESLALYVEVPPRRRRVPQQLPPPERQSPKREDLARALFRTDPRVRMFVGRVADATLKPGALLDGSLHSSGRIDRAFAVAWGRDEHGWRTEAYRHADQVLACLAP